MSGINVTVIEGRVPHFDPSYKKGEGEKGRSHYISSLSVQRNYKPDGEQYYPEDLIRFKAFGPTADFINGHFAKGDGLGLRGRLQIDEDYEDKDGVQQKGQLYLLVEEAFFPAGGGKKTEGGEETPKNTSKQSGKAPAAKNTDKGNGNNPLAGNRKKPF
jgi:single-stranded DNA-binding protein